MIAIMARELRSYFKTPVGYVFVGLFLLVTGVVFTATNLFSGSSNYTTFLSNFLVLYVFAVPLLTMRLLSEERRQRTDQLLLTSPITVTGIVVGKFLAAFAVYLITLLTTILYAAVIGIFGDLAFWETVGGYVGSLLLGGSLIAVGVLISAATENQVSAAFFSFLTILLIFLLQFVVGGVPRTLTTGIVFGVVGVVGIGLFFFFNTRNWVIAVATGVVAAAGFGATYLFNPVVFQGLLVRTLGLFSLFARLQSFTIGLVKLDEVLFHVSFTAVFLFFTIRLIEKRRWS